MVDCPLQRGYEVISGAEERVHSELEHVQQMFQGVHFVESGSRVNGAVQAKRPNNKKLFNYINLRLKVGLNLPYLPVLAADYLGQLPDFIQVSLDDGGVEGLQMRLVGIDVLLRPGHG